MTTQQQSPNPFEKSVFGEALFNENAEQVHQKFPFFSYLRENSSHVLDFFRDVDIEAVKFFDEIGTNLENIECQRDMTLLLFPVDNKIRNSGKSTKESMRNDGIKVAETQQKPLDWDMGLLLDIFDRRTEILDRRYFLYLSQANVLVAKVNPLHNENMFKKFMEDIYETYSKGLIEKVDYMEKQINSIRQALQKDIQNDIAKHRINIERIENNLCSLRAQYSSEYRKYLKESKILNDLENSENKEYDDILEEFRKLQKNPLIKDLFVKNSSICVSFGDIYLQGHVIPEPGEDPVKKNVWIGELLFKISPGEGVKVTNLSSDKLATPHPHANSVGNVCLGEQGLELEEKLRESKYTEVVKLLYSFATTYYEEGGPYKKIQHFHDMMKRFNQVKQ